MLDFIKQAFTDNGSPSSSRLLSAVCTIASLVWITHFVYHSHTLPDAVTLAGITAFNTAFYIANRVTGIPR